MSVDYNVYLGGNLAPQLEFLQSELQRLKFEEEKSDEVYNQQRQELQDLWNKFQTLHHYLGIYNKEIEEVEHEIAKDEMERTYWHESLEDVQQRIHSYQRHQEEEEEETKNWRDQLARKDSLLARLGELETAAADCRKRQQLCTQQLRKLIPSTTQSSFSLSTTSFSVSGVSSVGGKLSNSVGPGTGGSGGGQESSNDSITQSLAVRSQLIETTRELNDIEIEQERWRQELIKVQEALERSLLTTNRSPKIAAGGGGVSHSSYQHYSFQRDNIHSSGESIASMKTMAGGSLGVGGNDEEMSEMITHGVPFSPDLVSHLLSGLPLQPSTGNDETWPTTPPASASNGDNFYSVDEVVNDSSFVTSFYRMQGESARYYLKRLRSRRENLIYLQFSVAKAFTQQLAKVKHGRHRQRERELRRLRLEMQKMQLEKVQAEALVAGNKFCILYLLFCRCMIVVLICMCIHSFSMAWWDFDELFNRICPTTIIVLTS